MTSPTNEQLVYLAQHDCREARDLLVTRNMGLVWRVIRRYRKLGSLTEEDLAQEGSLGLLDSIDRFKLELGYKFSTYAWQWIRQRVDRALKNQSLTVRIPFNLWPSETEKLFRQPLSLDKQMTGDDIEGTLGDIAPDPGEGPAAQVVDDIEDRERRELILDYLSCLTPLQQRVLTLRYGLDGEPPLSLQQIGSELGSTREWIWRVEQKAFRMIKEKASGVYRVRRKPPPLSPETRAKMSASAIRAHHERRLEAQSPG